MSTFGSNSGDRPGGNTYLDTKEWSVDPADLPFPTHGDELPSVTLPAPVRDEGQVSVPDGFETDLLMTFIYTTCNTMCPRLTAIMAQVQDHTLKEGYSEEVSFAEITFDPNRDDAEAIRKFADKHNVEMDADNWYFLRPESEARTKEVVQESYGVHFTKTNPESMDSYMFSHTGLILLANKKGYVERAYKLQSTQGSDQPRVTRQEVTDDLKTLRERES